jgi:hypothetical protein
MTLRAPLADRAQRTAEWARTARLDPKASGGRIAVTLLLGDSGRMAGVQVSSNWRSINQVLTAGFYKIPRFQRAYSWDRANVEDFWEDLFDSHDGYFIGSMVIYTNGDASGLVDGQQRLTTITILLAALRNELRDIGGEQEAKGLQTLIERLDLNARRRFVLETETSYPYLQGQIQSEPAKEAKNKVAAGQEERALAQAFSILGERVHSISEGVEMDASIAKKDWKREKIKRLSDVRDKLLKLTVVLVEVDDEDDATVIFQTLNSRGKDLEVADLVKSHLFALLKPQNTSFDEVRDRWNSVLQSFDDSAAGLSMNKLLLHSWLSRHGYVGEKQLFKVIRSHVRPNTARSYLDELTSDADLYRIAQEPSYKAWQKSQRELRESLDAMVLFKLAQPLPMVLALLRELEAGALKPRVVLKGLRAIESYHYIATAVTHQPSSGGVSRMYSAAARAIMSGKNAQKKSDAIDEISEKLRERLPSLAEFEASFLELRSSKEFTQQTNVVRYTLKQMHVAATEGVEIGELDLDALTIEHLVPQGSKRPASVDPSDVARIGNLILVTEELNKQLDDMTFSAKQQVLKAKQGVEEEILKATSWTKTTIEDRTKRLAKRAYKEVWRF